MAQIYIAWYVLKLSKTNTIEGIDLSLSLSLFLGVLVHSAVSIRAL